MFTNQESNGKDGIRNYDGKPILKRGLESVFYPDFKRLLQL